MRSDQLVREDVERELRWEPSIDERHIGVAVVDGVVTLSVRSNPTQRSGKPNERRARGRVSEGSPTS